MLEIDHLEFGYAGEETPTMQFNLGVEAVGLTRVVRAKIDRSGTTANTDLRIRKGWIANGDLRVLHGAVAPEELGRERVGPL